MTNYLRISLLVYSLFFTCACSNRMTLNKLKEQISSKLAEQPGYFAVAFKDLATGESILLNEHMLFHAASTMKHL